LEKRLIQIYTGNGKGKTTAALGLALRASGWGLRVLFVEFLKPISAPCGEKESAPRIGFSIRRISEDSFIGRISPELKKKTCDLIRKELEDIRQKMQKGEFDLYILDELVTAVSLGILPEEDVLSLMKDKPDKVELVLTGRGASEKLIEHADLVSDIRSIKHPYQKGIPSRQGIEF
jgi:cob(I)alamin adenosyltransferase